MPTLSNPTLKIDPLTGTTYRVTAKVTVQFTPWELSLMAPIGPGLPAAVSVKLKSNLWGYDGDELDLGGDDNLFSFRARNITRSATYTFSTTVSSRLLNEDSSLRSQDEIYNKFSLVSESNIPTGPGISDRSRNSPIIRAFYGSSGV
jgi:hypothetical protein